MRTIFLVLAVVCYISQTRSEDVRLLDLEPNDAENLIEKQDQTLKYAPKIEEQKPAVRILGKEAHNVLEDIYLAQQYHGQDGLGGYIYGYSVPDIAKTERKKASGDLRGSYNYINGAGQEIKVEYWDEGTGFHQTDNIPQILPKQIEDSPEVQAAKDAFLKRWHEEAERNTHPVKDPYNVDGQYATGPLSAQGQQQRAQFFAQQENQPAASGQQQIYVQQPKPQYQQVQQQQNNEGAYNPDEEGKYVPEENEEEVTGPPKGFFYKFDYPVGIIVQDQGRALNVDKAESLKNVYEENKQRFERQVLEGSAKGSSQYHIV